MVGVGAQRRGFEELLAELAAEHERIAELNRILLERVGSFPPTDDAEVPCYPSEAAPTSNMCSPWTSEALMADSREPRPMIGRVSSQLSMERPNQRQSCGGSRASVMAEPRYNPLSPVMSSLERQDVPRTVSQRSRTSSRRSLRAVGNFDYFARKEALKAAGLTFAASSNWAINPENIYMGRWDLITTFSLCFVAIVCPVQISMLEESFDTLFFVNCIIDLVFFIDMFLQFFVMYPKVMGYGTVLEHRPRHIAKNYLRSWFAVDLLSVVPFDPISMLSNHQEMQKYKVVKVIRVIRLMKLVRIMRASRLFRRFEHRMSISYKQWALLRFFIILIAIIHWMANLWALTLVLVEESDNVPRWVDAFAELEINVATKTKDTPWKLYLASVYFTSYTLTSVGYGDIGPQNIVERVVCIVMIMISGTAWAVVLGQVSGIVANMNADEQAFRKGMDELNLMMRERAFPLGMRQRLRGFFHSNKQAQRQLRLKQNVQAMSSGLRGEVAIQINKVWIQKVGLLNSLMKQMETSTRGRQIYTFIIEICQALQVEVHAQSEIFGRPHVLYIVNRGVVSRPPRLHLQGAVWGSDFVLVDKELLEPSESFTLTYTELTVLTRDSFFQTAIKYKNQCPQLGQTVRRYCIWLAFQRAVMREAKYRQNLAAEAGLENTRLDPALYSTDIAPSTSESQDVINEPLKATKIQYERV